MRGMIRHVEKYLYILRQYLSTAGKTCQGPGFSIDAGTARRRIIEFYLILILLCLMLAAVIYIFFRFTGHAGVPSPVPEKQDAGEKKKLPCILCGAPLARGENLKSEEYRGEEESIVKIFGCPYCCGDRAVRIRRCPVCKKVMPPDGYLTGRMWKTRKGKMHLHVSGCTECAGKKVSRSGS